MEEDAGGLVGKDVILKEVDARPWPGVGFGGSWTAEIVALID